MPCSKIYLIFFSALDKWVNTKKSWIFSKPVDSTSETKYRNEAPISFPHHYCSDSGTNGEKAVLSTLDLKIRYLLIIQNTLKNLDP